METPTKTKIEKSGKKVNYYYNDINNVLIKIGDNLEIKSLIGGYGRTEIFTGTLLSIDAVGDFLLDISNTPTRVRVDSDLDFSSLHETPTQKNMVFNTTTKHGFGAMDVHAHNTYVKIL